MQSLTANEKAVEWLSDYGMVIIDECHHVPAGSFETVMKRVSSRFLYGLTATPKRKDGHHPILTMYLEPIRYATDAKTQATQRPFAHLMIPRFTAARFLVTKDDPYPGVAQYYTQMTSDELRNHLIIDDILECAAAGRNCLVLSERLNHVELLASLLKKNTATRVFVFVGGKTDKQTKQLMEELKATPLDSPLIICATGKYIGEGFDEARLDTLFLTMPISWQGTLSQYAGRLHRLHDGKKEVRIYDYIDSSSAILERMYHKRLKGYAAIGYQVAGGKIEDSQASLIYDCDSFQQPFLDDIANAQRCICISSPYVFTRRLPWIESVLKSALKRKIKIAIFTRPEKELSGTAAKKFQSAYNLLESWGISLTFQAGCYQKFAVIDEKTVWYGSLSILGYNTVPESIMRLESGSIAKVLMDQ